MSESRPGRFRVEPEKKLLNSLTRFLLIGVGVLILAVGVALFKPALDTYHQLQVEVEELGRQLEEERARLDRHKREIDLVKNDPEYLELLARDLRPLMLPEETIYQVVDPRPSPPPSP